MAVLGKLLKNRRAGQAGLAWNVPGLSGPETLALSSPDLDHEGQIATTHASKRAGGSDRSPALTWAAVPEGTAQLLLVVEDPDAPTRLPFVHCVALLEPSVTSLAQGALDARSPQPGVRVLRSGMGRGYLGTGADQGPRPASVRVSALRPGQARRHRTGRRRTGVGETARRAGCRRSRYRPRSSRRLLRTHLSYGLTVPGQPRGPASHCRGGGVMSGRR